MTDPYKSEPTPYSATNYPAEGRTNTLAIIALVLGIVVPVAGIVTGHIALNQIKRTGEQGHGLALAGTIIGYALTVLGILALILYIVFFAYLINNGGFESVNGY